MQLYERLLMAEDDPAAAAPAPAAAQPAAPAPPELGLPETLEEALDAPLVGRQAPLQRLRAELKSVSEGGGSGLVLLAGEGGIGKTRLAAELAREAADGR